MNWPIITTIASSTLATAAVAFAVTQYLSSSRSRRFQRSLMMERDLFLRDRFLRYDTELRHPEKAKSDRKTLAEIVAEKKKKFEDITGISFHFVDAEAIRSFYNDTFKEPEVESLVAKIAGEITGDVKAGFPQLLESKLGGKQLSEWISTIKLPDTSLPGMFAKYQREAIKRGEVTLGLEEVDIELNELQQFESVIDNLQKSFGLALDKAVINTHTSKLKQKAAETMVSKLENAAGWVLIEGRFSISMSPEKDMYRCKYIHPVNEYFPKDATPITISFTLSASLIEKRYTGNYTQSVGRLISLRVYGKVWQPINRSTNTWDLEITPYAIY